MVSFLLGAHGQERRRVVICVGAELKLVIAFLGEVQREVASTAKVLTIRVTSGEVINVHLGFFTERKGCRSTRCAQTDFQMRPAGSLSIRQVGCQAERNFSGFQIECADIATRSCIEILA